MRPAACPAAAAATGRLSGPATAAACGSACPRLNRRGKAQPSDPRPLMGARPVRDAGAHRPARRSAIDNDPLEGLQLRIIDRSAAIQS